MFLSPGKRMGSTGILVFNAVSNMTARDQRHATPAWRLRRRLASGSQSLLRNASFRDEINRKAPQPMTSFVMLASHRCQSSVPVLLGSRPDHGQAFISFGQARSDALQHPCATQVEPIQMCQLGVTGIGRYYGPQPIATSR